MLFLYTTLFLPQTQDFITQKANKFLVKKLGNKASVARVGFTFPGNISLSEIFIKDKNNDTLLFAESVFVNIDLTKLLRQNIHLDAIEIKNASAFIKRSPHDSSFNFQYIIESFSTPGNPKISKSEITTENEPDFGISDILLRNIFLNYSDELEGRRMILNLGRLSTNFTRFDLKKNIYRIDEFNLEESLGKYTSFSGLKTSKDTAQAGLNLEINSLQLNAIAFTYSDLIKDQKIGFGIGKLQINEGKTELLKEILEAEKIELSNCKFSLNNSNIPKLTKGFDYNYLDVENINMQLAEFNMSGNRVKANLKDLNFYEKRGFRLERLMADFKIEATKATLNNFNLITGKSNINFSASAAYESPEDLYKNYENLNVTLELPESRISMSDLAYFISNEIIENNKKEVIILKAQTEGTTKQLHIKSLEAGLSAQTKAVISGTIQEFLEPEKSFYNLNEINISVSAEDISRIAPDTLIPVNLQLPEKILISGNFIGLIDDFKSEFEIGSDFGKINSKIAFIIDSSMLIPEYSADVILSRFDIGKLLKIQEIGAVSLTAGISGSGFNQDSIVGKFKALISEASINNYSYKNIDIHGNVENVVVSAVATVEDTNIRFDLEGKVNLTSNNPELIYTLNLKHANPVNLNLSDEINSVKFYSEANLKGSNIDSLNGFISIKDIQIKRELIDYVVNFFELNFESDPEINNISIASDFLTADLSGNISLTKLPETITDHLGQYFSSEKNIIEKPEQNQNFAFNVLLAKSDFVKGFLVSGLKDYEPVSVSGNYNSGAKELQVYGHSSEVIFNDVKFDSLTFSLNSDYNKLYSSVTINRLSNKDYGLQQTHISSEIEADIIHARLQIWDSLANEKFFIAGLISQTDSLTEIKIIGPEIIINSQKWKVTEENQFLFGNGIVSARNIELRRDNSYLRINSVPGNSKAYPLLIEMGGFDLALLSKLIERKIPLITGVINGRIVFENLPEESQFTSDLIINNFSYKGDTIGDVLLKSEMKGKNVYEIHSEISGNNNKAMLEGIFDSENENDKLNFNLNILNLDISSIESFPEGILSNMSGSMIGDLRVRGNPAEPDITGKLLFKNTTFTLDYLNTAFTLQNQPLDLSPGQVLFNGFTLKDVSGNEAVLNGRILYSENISEPDFDLKINTRNFKALDTGSDANDFYYGVLVLDSDIKLAGNFKKPEITATIKLLEPSAFTIVIPGTSAEVADREGVVVFFDADTSDVLVFKDSTQKSDTIRAELTGFDLQANIEVDKNVPVKVIVDEQAGDYLLVNGDALINLEIDPAGNINLTGNYEIEKGFYQLSFYNYLKKEFRILKGSSIVWKGDPLEADVDIEASYTVNTSPLPLIENQLQSNSSNKNYDQKLPFNVILNITDQLIAPQMKFVLDMPDSDKGALGGLVYSRLLQLNEQESELNKQVFGLLVLNNFIRENPLDIKGAGISTRARTSVSRFLSQQLNVLSGKYIKGVDVSVELESYETSTEARTDLQVDLSKQLFNERVKVQLGGDIPIEGSREQQKLTDITSDVIIEYKITDDGRYLLKGFRQKEFESLIDGELIETGVSVIYTREYDTVFDFLKRKK